MYNNMYNYIEIFCCIIRLNDIIYFTVEVKMVRYAEIIASSR